MRAPQNIELKGQTDSQTDEWIDIHCNSQRAEQKYFSLFVGIFSHFLELETKCQYIWVHTNAIITRKQVLMIL